MICYEFVFLVRYTGRIKFSFLEDFMWRKNILVYCTSSVIRQKDESKNGCFKKTKHATFSEKRTFLTLWYAHARTYAYKRLRNVRFLENVACFVFLKHPFWDSPFCLITEDMYQYAVHVCTCILYSVHYKVTLYILQSIY